MARFRADEADNYGGSGSNAAFFKLADDGDTAIVRFMYRDVDDIEGFSVHEIKLNDKKRYVNCLREYNDPISACPMCAAGRQTQAKVFVPLYDENTGTVKIWERGKKFFNKLSKLCSRHPNLVSHVFELERNGKAGDTSTTYEIYPAGDDYDELDLEDLPEVPQILGSFVLDKTAEEMEEFLDTGNFPNADENDDTPRRRNTGSKNKSRTPERRGKASRRHEEEDEPDDIEGEIPFGNGDDEEEDERPARRDNARGNSRRTPGNSRRKPSDKF